MENNIEKIKKDIESILSPKRYNHSVGVMERAEKLAKIYGIDIQECDERKKKFAQGLVDLFYSKPKLSIERVEKGLNERYNIPISVRKILERYLNILKENNETEEVSIVENLLEKRIKSDIEGR